MAIFLFCRCGSGRVDVKLWSVTAALLASVIVAGSAWAAEGQGAIASGIVAATAVESSTKVSVTGAFGYRFNRAIGLEAEVTTVPTLRPDTGALAGSTTVVSSSGPVGVSFGTPSSAITASDGRATFFTTNFRVEIPTTVPRIIPYVVGGGGVANVKESFTFNVPVPRVTLPGVLIPPIPPQQLSQSSTDLALTLGGGASVLAASHVSIDVDLRYFRLLGNRDLNVGRFGVGVSYRF